MGSGKRLGTGVGNGGWKQGLATFMGKKRKGTRNKEQGLKTGAVNKD